MAIAALYDSGLSPKVQSPEIPERDSPSQVLANQLILGQKKKKKKKKEAE